MKKKFNYLILTCLIFSAFSVIHAETTLIKNATVYLPSHVYQKESYVIIQGSKIFKVGNMVNLKEVIFDNEYDLKGGYLYPAFIDSYYSGFQDQKKKDDKKEGPKRDKHSRPPLSDRHPHIKKNISDKIILSKTAMKKLIKSGFSYAHVVPDKGIIGGTTAVLSLHSSITEESILIPDKFMNLILKPHSKFYPTTLSSIISDLKQIKEDSLYYHKQKKWQHNDQKKRLSYTPEYEILHPYFTGYSRFVIKIKDILEQRVTEIIAKDLDISPVIVGHSDIWRRPVRPQTEIILPLNYKPPLSSLYSKKGDKAKKDYEKNLYPKKLAEFFNSYDNVSLTAPEKGDYKTLYKNIRDLMKNGVKESRIIDSLTEKPAKLLDIQRYAGNISSGKLASFFVTDKKVFEEKSKVKMAFVEGKIHEFLEKPKDLKPPVRNISGSYTVKLESQMGNFEMKLILEQDENQLEGKITSEMMGTLDLESGTISADEVSFSVTANMMGNEVKIQYSGKVKEDTIKGTVTLGSFGDATFTATPEQ